MINTEIILTDDLVAEIEASALSAMQKQHHKNWIFQNNKYYGSIGEKIVQTLESGVYKIDRDCNGKLYCCQQELNSDELLIFEESDSSEIINKINKFWKAESEFKNNNLLYKRGVLLEGPPGTGKSSIITLLCKQLISDDGLIFLVNGVDNFYNTSKFLKDTVKSIEPDRKIIIIIEDVDKYIKYSSDFETLILDFLDGKSSLSNYITILTSNNTEDLSEALLRPGRIDDRYVVSGLSEKSIRLFLKNKGLSDTRLDEYLKYVSGLTIAQIKHIFVEVEIMGRDLPEVVKQINNPTSTKNYLNLKKSNNLGF